MRSPVVLSQILSIGTLLALGLVGSACETHTVVHTQEPVVTSAYVEAGPPIEHIRAAPLIYYEGHPVFWYNGHWFYRENGNWAFYRVEPGALRPHRYVIRY